MAKSDKFYFENFVASTELAKSAATYLVECLENYDANNIEKMLETMHVIENDADIKKHEMDEALAKAFVTPVDREDLDLVSHQIDDVVDLIEEVLQCFYIYDIQAIKPEAIEFAKNIVKSCDLLVKIMNEFERFKKSKELHSLIVTLNDLEEECDDLYLASMRALTKNETNVLEVFAWRKTYESLEKCVDTCEHVSECISSVIMKNT